MYGLTRDFARGYDRRVWNVSSGEAVEVAKQRDALTELVRQQVGGEGRRYSTRAFAEVAIDPSTGWAPSKSLVGKIIKGESYKVTPEFVSAIAVGLGLDREIVAAAAHFQVIGYRASELTGGAPATVLEIVDREPGEMPLARAVAEEWDRDERQTQG